MPKINGQEFSWSNVTITAGGVDLEVVAVKYKASRKKENILTTGDKPTRRSYGDVEFEASVTVLLSDLFALQENVPNDDISLIEPFNVIISWRPKLKKNTEVVRLVSAEFLEYEVSASQGDMKVEVELPLIISDIVKG